MRNAGVRRVSQPLLVLLFAVLSIHGQNFRGAINGTVSDPSGAVVPGATVEALNASTGVSWKAVTSSGGEFQFAGLPIGSYNITVTAAGFKTEQIAGAPVSAGTVYTLPVKLTITSQSQTIQVSASALALDTTSTVQTTDIPSETVQDVPMNGRDFTQMIAVTPGYAGYSGGGYGSVNGTRPDMVNWQINGADNNDVWWNVPAANQGGVSGIAGVTLPIDAIDQFSALTEASPETGRNPGATVNLVIKSGGNSFHGTAYYFNRNEALAAQSALSATKPELRNQQFGYSAGGPFWRDHAFFFTTYEEQKFIIGVNQPSTEPSTAYQSLALQQLNAWGIPESQTAVNLLNGTGGYQGLWPTSALTGPAQPFNYVDPANETGTSHNGLVHLDYNLNPGNKISFIWYVGQGPQIAPTVSLLSQYFEVAPMHVQNYSLTWNSVFSPRLTNQLFAGVNYFNQVFSDQDTNYDPVDLGLNTGVTSPTLVGAPRIEIASPSASSGLGSSADGFDYVGATVNSGRNDITGHLDEALSWTAGKHEYRFGGEFRQAQIDDFYQSGERGTFVFDGSQGPWSGNAGTACDALATTTPESAPSTNDPDHVYALADFLAGCYDASITNIVQGNPKRQVFLNSWALFAQDAWQFSPRFNVNYGLRYEYTGPMHNSTKDLSTFLAGAPNGIATAGVNIANLYPQWFGGASPRLGFSWQPTRNGKTVVRGGWGLGFDSPNIVNLLNSRFSSNGGPFGVQDNPAGNSPVEQTAPVAATIPSGTAYGAPIFINESSPTNPCIVNPNSSACPSVNLFGISQNLRPGYVENFNLNVQRSLGPGAIVQVGYVGSEGHHLRDLIDVNQAAPGSGGANSARPYYSQYPNYGVINEIQSEAISNYNSLQALVRIAKWHGLTSQFAYTWSHSLDEQSEVYLYNPQNSLCFQCEYGNSDFDVKNTFTTYVTYDVPSGGGPKWLVKGWQLNSLLNFHGGQPFTVYSSNSGGSGNGEYAERADFNPGVSPYAGVSHSVQGTASSGYYVNWLNPNAFVPSANGAYGNTPRNVLYGPGYSDVDLSVFKNTQITERVTAQFRVEMFNVFNRLNLAAPGDGYCTDTSTCAIGTTIGNNYGAPGIGAGEPYNTQLAMKILF
jgi:Carboxypeptidase regulatory-like domain/TonB dependent receptor